MLVFVADVPKGDMVIMGSRHVGTTIKLPLGLVCCLEKKFISMLNWGCFISISVADEFIGTVALGFSTLENIPTLPIVDITILFLALIVSDQY